MLDHLAGAEAAINAAVADLRQSGNHTLLAQNEAQLAFLSELRRAIGSASATTIAALRPAILAAAAKAESDAGQARTASAVADTAETLHALAAESRSQVDAFLREPQRFDGGLRFASADEEAAYRQREAERRAYIEAEHGKGTPQGDLNAAGGALGQLIDTKAHSPGPTPELDQRIGELMVTTEKLRETAKANGVSTEEFDRHLRDDLRRIMKSKGLSEAEIDVRFAATPDPLEAAKAYIRNEGDLQRMRDSVRSASESPMVEAAAVSPLPHHQASDVLAKLKGAGVSAAQTVAATGFTHGLHVGEPVKPANRTLDG